MARKNNREQIETVQQFRKLVHSGIASKSSGPDREQAPMRIAMVQVRRTIKPAAIARVVADAMTNGIYRVSMVPSEFPQDFAEIRPKPPLRAVSAEVDFLWNAAVLAYYTDKINRFLRLKQAYESSLLIGKFEECERTLDALREELGVSHYYIDAMLKFLQVARGVAAQKAFLQEVIATPGIHVTIAWASYFSSVGCEETASRSALEREYASIRDAPRDVFDYFRFLSNPFEILNVETPFLCLSRSECMPIVDRYLAFVAMAQLETIRSDDPAPWHVRQAVTLLNEISDARLHNLIVMFDEPSRLISSFEGGRLAAHDKYSAGDYAGCATTCESIIAKDFSDPTLYELYSRSLAYRETQNSLSGGETIFAKIITSLLLIIQYSSLSSVARADLERLALLLKHTNVSLFIVSFISRQHSFVLVDAYSEADALGALCGSLENPWLLDLLERLFDRADIINSMSARFPNSLSVKLQSLLRGQGEPEGILARDDIPPDRRNIYRGHIAFNAGRPDLAVDYYRASSGSKLLPANLTANAFLFRALVSSGDITAAVSLAVSTYFQNENTFDLYDMEYVLTRAMLQGLTEDVFLLPIALSLYSRRVGPKFDRDLSDLFEQALEVCSVQKPSELRDALQVYARHDLVYFLRHNCAMRFLEDLYVFETLADVEQERIAILQWLLEIDPKNAATYSEEIKGITRDMEVAALLRRVDESRIFVDEDGLRRTLEIPLGDRFKKYREMISSPLLEYQSAEILKRFRELAKDAEPELRNLWLPRSERESLFVSLLNDAVSTFVSNAAYGLETYLSTRIRHGAIEGELRSALAKRGLAFLIMSRDRTADSITRAWGSTLECLDDRDKEIVVSAIAKFSAAANALIQNVQANIVRPCSAEYPNGLFDYIATEAEISDLMDGITSDLSFEQFISMLLEHFWRVVARSLERIKDYLANDFAEAMNATFLELDLELEKCAGRPNLAAVMDAIAHARTDFSSDLARVTNWFNRAKTKAKDPFHLETAVEVALRSVRNCFPKLKIVPALKIKLSDRMRAEVLEPVVDLLFNLLFNAIEHAETGDRCPDIWVTAARDEANVLISVQNELGPSKDLNRLREEVRLYQTASSGKSVSFEGGSGMRKVERILSFDIGIGSTIEYEVTDSRVFEASIAVPAGKVLYADIPN